MFTLVLLHGQSTMPKSEALFHINANIDKTVSDLFKINRQIIWILGILIGQKTRVNTYYDWMVE